MVVIALSDSVVFGCQRAETADKREGVPDV